MLKKFLLIITILSFQLNYSMQFDVSNQILQMTKKVTGFICPEVLSYSELSTNQLDEESTNLQNYINHAVNQHNKLKKYFLGIAIFGILTLPLEFMSCDQIPYCNGISKIISFSCALATAVSSWQICLIHSRIAKLKKIQNISSKRP
ncbi:hypothetical protein M1446_00425 [Candidatus Dependentiae bacterium]|nr:hypothetical protein [Candidatus Dependentiae bacterium]